MSAYIRKGLVALAVGAMLAGSAGGAQARGQSSGSSAAGSYVPGQAEGERASAGVSQYSAPETGGGGDVPQFGSGENGEADQMTGAMMMPGSASGSRAPGMTDGSYSNMNIGGEDSALLPGVN
ncbi:hypothetical protein CFR78_07415 [Komagataeibacter rhaeticus]|uniref:Uncharacterized protein n=1 Tax=Komagataeibacter rhaeticus TaxID=215221 RepID=A0A181CDE5_9PROT|nr:hypothetical protein [Komagataeibacter rhaeticus]ATU71744.1 hypothetical protein CT154_01725 [Komagataeibacter xylinus]KDU95073.1 hypothetical protein GLUCORHAEAF1_10255 [Komagataeibacter rhaeticus AF1]MBL7239199.1 hypothetical protein [Komagataeibacter rhaeticus]PYD53788.1 hypothetical protein CFR78_07415 [Komagataeibacter rhaeticus]QIP36179.1 hypothetical protein GWK63_12425 [Komagataeibacter rhaeticus]